MHQIAHDFHAWAVCILRSCQLAFTLFLRFTLGLATSTQDFTQLLISLPLRLKRLRAVVFSLIVDAGVRIDQIQWLEQTHR